MSFGADGVCCRIEVPLARKGSLYGGNGTLPVARPGQPLPAAPDDPLRSDPV